MLLYTSGGVKIREDAIIDAPPAVGPPDKNSDDSTDGDCGTMFILFFSYLGSSSGIPTR